MRHNNSNNKCVRDSNNVIKISEIIIALIAVPPSIVNTNETVTFLAEKLRAKMKDDQGWSYFIDIDEPIDILPTAHAYYALSKLGNDQYLIKPKTYILDYLTKRYVQPGEKELSNFDTIADVFCLYVLTISDANKEDLRDRKHRKKIFDKIWVRLKSLLSSDIEQNVEYLYKDESEYVRIPWQLYLLFLAAHYDFRNKFSKVITINKLNHILTKINAEGYLYPYSGRNISARTYAIIDEVLGHILSTLNHGKFSTITFLFDVITNAFTTKIVRWPIRGILIIIIFIIIFKAYPRSPTDYSGLATNFIAAILFGIFSAFNGKR